MTVKEFYDSIGGDYEDAINRFRMESLVQKFLLKFPEDTSYQELVAAVEAGETETAFKAAHTLKGVTANLSMEKLRAASSEVTELLRAGDLEGAKPLMPAVDSAYAEVMEAIKKMA